MTIRISDQQIVRNMMSTIAQNRRNVDKHGQEVSTGIKVASPGDSTFSGSVSSLKGVIERIAGYENRIKSVESSLTFQESVLDQASELLIRAKEIASQGANETNSPTERLALAEEIFQLRDHMVSLANSQYQGIYIFHGNATNLPPYMLDTYDTGTDGATRRYVYDNRTPQASGHADTRNVRVTDNLTVRTNTDGQSVFENSILALERLGRSLQGFRTTEPASAIGVPGTGAAYTEAEFATQTSDILSYIEDLDIAREQEVQPERVDIAGRLKRLETAGSLLELSKVNAKEVLSKLQDVDMVEAASNLSIAQTALEASMAATSRVMNISILQYL
jgi:flagellar hook-associated protein 3 FlgL